MGQKKYRTILFYKNYFNHFFEKQPDKLRKKIIWTLSLLEELPVIPSTYLKHIEGSKGLYEIRVKQQRDLARIFCFFDKGKIIVLTSGSRKKTPKEEIKRAERIKREYEEEKHNNP